MLFEHSYSGNQSRGIPAQSIFKGWEILWEYNNQDDVFNDRVRFVAKFGERYCIADYEIITGRRRHPILIGYTDDNFSPNSAVDAWTVKEREEYLRRCMFFDNIQELFDYAKSLKRIWVLAGCRKDDTRLQILLAIKKEYMPFIEYQRKYHNKNRLDMVDD